MGKLGKLHKKVTVAVVTFGRLAYTKRCLESLIKTTPKGVPIWVFDNASWDGTQKYLQQLVDTGKVQKIFKSQINIGTAAAKNWLAREAKTEFICCFDNDFIYFDNWLQKIITAFVNYPRIMAITPWNLHELSPVFRLKRRNQPKSSNVILMQKVGGNLVLRREEMLAVGGYQQQRSTFAGMTATPMIQQFQARDYQCACIAGKLAIGLDRLESNFNLREDPEYKAYREWIHLQTRHELIIPDFTTLRKALVDVVIPVYGSIGEVKKCLQGLYQHTVHPFKLFVVDDGSSLKDHARLKQLQKQYGFALLKTSGRTGFPAACNEGYHAGNAPFVCFLNSDTIPGLNWMMLLVSYLLRHRKCGSVGPSTSRCCGPQQVNQYHSKRMQMKVANVAAVSTTILKKNRLQPELECNISGFCFMTRRELLDHTSGFDTRYQLGYGEEDHYQVLLQRIGYTSWWVPYVYVHHFGGVTFKRLPKQQIKSMRRKNKSRLLRVKKGGN